jgi:flagellar basal-body rod modification protein FlgD
MASIGTTYPTSSSTSATSTSTSSSSNNSSSSSSTNNADSLANTQTFLSLLLAQLQNQYPMQPEDGTQFVSQLAEFTNLEQSLAMRTDLDDISSKYTGASSAATSGSTSSSADGTSGTSGTSSDSTTGVNSTTNSATDPNSLFGS